MLLSNYHSHTLFCDGRADMEPFIRFALSKYFRSFGFSSHAPLPFPTRWTMEWDRMDDYIQEFRRLKKKYEGRLELILGLEIDYISDEHNPAMKRFRELPLDFRIGSVHLLPDRNGELVDIDCPPQTFRRIVDEHFDGNIESVIRLYYQRITKMMELGGFDILGHCDKIHYNASCYRQGLLDEKWYDDFMHDYFKLISTYDYQVEINTKSFPELHTFYPNERYFRYMHDLGIRVQVNSDAHYPDRITNGLKDGLRALQKAGYTSVVQWHDGRWNDTPLIL